jgi:uncharacterized membrane-anchored protein
MSQYSFKVEASTAPNVRDNLTTSTVKRKFTQKVDDNDIKLAKLCKMRAETELALAQTLLTKEKTRHYELLTKQLKVDLGLDLNK